MYAQFNEFVVYGVTHRPPVLAAGELTSWIMLHELQTPVSIPEVYAGVFVIPGSLNRAAVILASIADSVADVSFSLSSGGWSGGRTSLYDGVNHTLLQMWSTLPNGVINVTFSHSCAVRVLVVEDALVPGPRRSVASALSSVVVH